MAQNVKWVTSKCQVCKKEFEAINYRLLIGKDKYCSRACRGKSPEFKEQLAQMIKTRQERSRAKHPKWKDNKRVCLDCDKTIGMIYSRCKQCFSKSQIGTKRVLTFVGNGAYTAVHQWIYRQLGKPKICQSCGKKGGRGSYQWANLSKEYKRMLNDWIRLCRSCHIKFDKNDGTAKKDFMERMKNRV